MPLVYSGGEHVQKLMSSAIVVQKLVRANIWGGKHTPLDFLTTGIPGHYRNTHQGKKLVEKTLKELVNDQWVIITLKRTWKGIDEHVSLNPRKVREIQQFLEGAK